MPFARIFAEKETLLDIPTMRIAALNIEEVEPANAEDAFIAAICSIIAVAFPVMKTSSRQMRQPPEQ